MTCENYLQFAIVLNFLQAYKVFHAINACIGFYWAKVERETQKDDAHLMVLETYQEVYG